MKILIIEDYERKYNDIKDAIDNIYKNNNIIWAKSQTSDINEFKKSINDKNKFDLIICDNYMPIYDNTKDKYPCAENIIKEIKSIDKDSNIIICSSEQIYDIDADYFILYKYDSNITSKLDYYNNYVRKKIRWLYER